MMVAFGVGLAASLAILYGGDKMTHYWPNRIVVMGQARPCQRSAKIGARQPSFCCIAATASCGGGIAARNDQRR